MLAPLSDGLCHRTFRLAKGCPLQRVMSRIKASCSGTKAFPLTQSLRMSDAKPSVLIIDDDAEFCDSVARLLRSVGLDTQQFSSVSDFFNAPPPDGPTCLVLDIRMPGRSGLELQRDLAAANRQVPIIFITAHGDIPMTVQAM